MENAAILDIVAYGAWNGGTQIDNTTFAKKGMLFKGGIPVTPQTIEERIGVRTRLAAPEDERIGQTALAELLRSRDIDPARIKRVIGATNVGDDKYELGPQVKHPFELVRPLCPDARAFDLYAGCPGFNVSVELIFMEALSGALRKGDLAVIIGAENIHRAKAFQENDTASIIFGDDALATALEVKADSQPDPGQIQIDHSVMGFDPNFLELIAAKLIQLSGEHRLDGIIVDNQMGQIQYRVPATAARIQQKLAELLYPAEAASGALVKFSEALRLYDERIDAFAFDIMSLERDPTVVNDIARSYVRSGKYGSIAAVYLDPDSDIHIAVYRGSGFSFHQPAAGIIDTLTRTHGCFGDYIHAVVTEDDVFGAMDGKGVFLYATRSAETLLTRLLHSNGMQITDVDLLIEHQANFAMIPMSMDRVLKKQPEPQSLAVEDFVADRMVVNIHNRGNCSVVCMQRLPYDLMRGALEPATIQGFAVNRNLEALKHAELILFDSVGAGMTRSAFLIRKLPTG